MQNVERVKRLYFIIEMDSNLKFGDIPMCRSDSDQGRTWGQMCPAGELLTPGLFGVDTTSVADVRIRNLCMPSACAIAFPLLMTNAQAGVSIWICRLSLQVHCSEAI